MPRRTLLILLFGQLAVPILVGVAVASHKAWIMIVAGICLGLTLAEWTGAYAMRSRQ